MIKNKRIIIIIASILVVLILGYLATLYTLDYKFDRELSRRCIQYDSKWTSPFGSWLGIDDCFGVISIRHAWDIDGFYLYDHVHEYSLAEIDELNQYKFQDNRIYVKNREPFACSVTDKDGGQRFCQILFQNNQMKTDYYDQQLDIPTYLVIDTQTGNVIAYNSLDQMPDEIKTVFESLETRN